MVSAPQGGEDAALFDGFRAEVGHRLLVVGVPVAKPDVPHYAVTRAISGKSSGLRMEATDRSTSSCGQYK